MGAGTDAVGLGVSVKDKEESALWEIYLGFLPLASLGLWWMTSSSTTLKSSTSQLPPPYS